MKTPTQGEEREQTDNPQGVCESHFSSAQHLSELRTGLVSQPISGFSQPIFFTLLATLTKAHRRSTAFFPRRYLAIALDQT